MKRTLAILIAVLLVLVLIPTTIFAAPDPGDPGQPGSGSGSGSGTDANAPAAAAQPAPVLATDFFEVLDASGAHVDFYPNGNDGLAAADAALEDGYTLSILQAVTLTAPYTFGAGRTQPISYTIDGTGVSATAGAPVSGSWVFGNDSALDKVTIRNVTLIGADFDPNATDYALTVAVSGAGNTVSVTLQGCTISGEVAIAADGALASTTGAAVQLLDGNTVYGSEVAIMNAASMLIADGNTIMGNIDGIQNAGKLYVAGGTIMGNADSGIAIGLGGTAYLAGGMISVTGTAYNGGNPVGAVMMDNTATLYVLGATLIAPASAAGATQDADPITENIYALCAADPASVHIYSMTATCAAGPWNNVAIPIADYSAVAGTENMATVTVGDTTDAEALIVVNKVVGNNVVPTVVAAFDLADAADKDTLDAIMQLVPHGGTLKLLIDMDVAGSPHLFDYMPEMDVTLEGAKAGNDPVVDYHSAVTSGVAAFYTSAHVTFKNITLRASADSLVLMRNAAYGSLTVGEGATLLNEKPDDAAAAADMQTGSTLIVAEGGCIRAQGRLLNVYYGSTFRLDGGEAKITSTAMTARPINVNASAAGFTAVTAVAKIEFVSGDMWTVGGPGYLLTDALASASVPEFEITSVRILSTVYVDVGNPAAVTAHAVTFTDNRVELLDETGAHVDYYNSIADALADVEDGYTIKVLGANHLEAKAIASSPANIAWTLDGEYESGKRAEVFAVWTTTGGDVSGNSAFKLNGNNSDITFSNIVLHSMNNAISVAAASTGGARMTLDNVFVYAGGALEQDALTGVASATAGNRQYALYIAAGNTVRITGEDSGVYIYYNGAAAVDYNWCAIRNAGTLTIEDGFYTNPLPGGYLIATRDNGTCKTTVTGGTFWANNDAGGSIFTVFGGSVSTSAATSSASLAGLVVANGTFVTNAGNLINTMNGTEGNAAYVTIAGGKFYSNRNDYTVSTCVSAMASLGNARGQLFNIIGGEFYFQGTAQSVAGADDLVFPATTNATVDADRNITLQESGIQIAVKKTNYIRYGLYDTTYALGAAENYVPSSGAGDPAELLTRDSYTKRVVAQTSAVVTPVNADVLVYAHEGDTDPAYAFEGDYAAYEAIMATYGMDGAVIELQSDCALPADAIIVMSDLGLGRSLTITGAGDNPVTLSLNAATAMTLTGDVTLKNIIVTNAAGRAVAAAGNGTVVTLEGAVIPTGVTVSALATLVIDEDSYVYATGANVPALVDGAGNLHVYGKVGYTTDDAIAAGLTASAISVINPSTTVPFYVEVHGTAWVATPSTGKGTIATKDGPFTSGTRYPGNVVVDDGARLESNYCFFSIRYGDLTVGNVHMYDTDRDGSGNLQNPDCTWYFDLENVNGLTLTNFTLETRGTAARPFYIACPADVNSGLTPTVTMTDVNITATLVTNNAYFVYIVNCNVYMTRVNLDMTNTSTNNVYGVRCSGSDVNPTGDRLEAVFTDCRWVFDSNKSTTLMYLYGYMNYTFEGDNGYYDMSRNGQVMQCLGATNAGGVTTINGGTFAKKGATQGMINMGSGRFDLVINNAFFDADKSSIFSLSGANTHLTINDGTFYRDGVLGSFISLSAAGVATINGGTVIMGTKAITLNTSYDSMLFSLTHADAVLNITGGDFIVNLDNFTNKIRAIMLATGGTFNMSGGSILVRGSAAGNATLQDGFCLQNHTYFNMSGGTITFEGQIAGTYHMIWTQGGYAASQSEIHLSGNAHIIADYLPVAGSAGNTGNHGMGIFYLRNGTPTFTMEGDVVLESRAAGCTLSNSAVLEPMSNANVTIDGGYIYDYNGGSAIHLWRGANVTINGGYFESNGQAVLLADNWTAGETSDYLSDLPHGFTVNGGTFVLQPSASYRAISNNDSVAWVAANIININGGIFIDNSLTSTQVFNRTTTVGTMMIRGGLIMASQAQSFFFKTVNGYSGTGDYRPRGSVSVVATSAPLVRYAGRNYYLYGSTIGNLLAPEVDPSADIRLYTDGDGNSHDGLLFTSTIKVAVLAALNVEAGENKISEYPGAGYYTIEYGTLVAPLDNILKANGDFSKAAFDAYNATAAAADHLPYAVIPAVNGITVDPNGDVRIRAALVGIDEDHYETFYTAQPYATITYYDNETDLNQVGEPWVIYPNFNTNRSVASLSAVCARELRDIKAVRGGEYLYKCTSASGAFSRYSAAQQAKLQSYVAHTHDYGHTGVCSICGDDLSVALAADQAVTIYSAFGSVAYYKVHLTAGVPYTVRLSNSKAGSYALYNADGNACAFADGRFNCTADGDYYLVFTGNALSITTLSIAHVHNAGYAGYCSICNENQSVEIEVGDRIEASVIKGETYYFHADLVANDYTFVTVNGNYTVYDANGTVVPTENNVFTAAQAGTYYFVVTATFSAKGSVYLEHVHNFGYTGVCSYPGCGETVTHDLVPYAQYSASHKNGDTIYFRTVVPAGLGSNEVDGRRFTLSFGDDFVGTYYVYDVDGTRVAPSGGGYALNSGATYYLVVNVQYTGTFKVTLGYTHEHNEDGAGIDHRGICSICGASVARTLQLTGAYQMNTVDGQLNYHFAIENVPVNYKLNIVFTGAEGATVRVYGQSATPTPTQAAAEASGDPTHSWFNYDEQTGLYWANDNARTLYVVVTYAENPGVKQLTVTTSHTHTYQPDGTCSGCGTRAATLTQATLNTAMPVNYTTDNTYYYAISYLNAGLDLTMNFVSAEATWGLYNAEGVEVRNSTQGTTYSCTAAGAYNLVVTPTAASTEGATLTLTTAATPAP